MPESKKAPLFFIHFKIFHQIEKSIPVKPYTPIPGELTVPVDQLEEVVASYVRKHAVSWVYKRRVEYPLPTPQPEANQQGSARKRQRFYPELW